MIRYRIALLVIISLCLTNCEEIEKINLTSDEGFPANPVNLGFLNSEYDDYNSGLSPGERERYDFFYSSNKNSLGSDFDIVFTRIDIDYSFENEVATVSKAPGMSSREYFTDKAQSLINTANNEYGPFLLEYNTDDDFSDWGYIFFYTQEESDKLDLKFVINEHDPNGDHGYSQSGPYNINYLNTTEYSEGYCMVAGDQLFYCSDKEGDFNIYFDTISIDSTIVEHLTAQNNSSSNEIAPINSDAHDKCPYVVDSLMVFASDRKGGFGGFDLYYSQRINGQWSEATNFGAAINTEYDEYRPIVRLYNKIPNDLMIFSSNRPGGKGGFDLYYVGIIVGN